MAASRARCGLSLCARVTRTRCLTNTRALLLDTTRLAKPLSDVSTGGFAASAMKRLNTGQLSTSSLVSSIAANSATEDPGSRPSSVGGGVSATENEDDDDPFMQEQKRRYDRCLRWLAIIMGENVENFTDKDVKEAIEYLMPSSLYAKDARPLFLHPTELHKKKKGQLFDVTGRPVSAAFYTGRIGYHDLIFDIYKQFERLESARFNAQNLPVSFETTPEDSETESDGDEVHEVLESARFDAQNLPVSFETTREDSETEDDGDKVNEKQTIKKIELENRLEETLDDKEDINKQFEKLESDRFNAQNLPVSIKTTPEDFETESDGDEVHEKQTTRPLRWIKKIELENRLEETLDDKEYEVVLHRLKKLAAQPDVHLVWDFLEKFVFKVSTPGLKQVPLQLDEQGRAHGVGHRKRAIAEVWIQKGSGHVSVNGLPLVQYLGRIEDRQQILFPFQVVDGVGHYDAECNVIGGGPSGQAGAIRLAISRALLNFSVEFQQPLLEAGLLIRDPRIVERKKPGQKKARKKFAWVKR